MQRDYEMALLVNSQLPEEAVEGTIKRYEEYLNGHGARVVNVDRWGLRKLAYEINKHQQAVYAFYQFEAETGMLPELDRVCKLDESVLRHMVVVVEEGFEPEAVEEEAAASSEADQEPEEEAEEEGAGDGDGEEDGEDGGDAEEEKEEEEA